MLTCGINGPNVTNVMAIQDNIRILDTHASLTFSGPLTFEGVVADIKLALRYCCENKIGKLLLDGRLMEGFGPPTVSQRFWFATELAKEARGIVKVAMVVRPEFIDPQKFGVTVATNRNLDTDVFSNDAEALKWLLGQRAP
jgi:hypothetical protein